MIFAEIDWTAVLQTAGVTLGGLIAVLGGWYLKILSAKQSFEKEQAELAAKIRKEDREEEARLKRLEEERQEEKDRKDNQADQKRERSVITELRSLLNTAIHQHEDDRQVIHELRNLIGTLSNRATLCEAQRAVQAKQIAILLKRAGLPSVPELDVNEILNQVQEGSKERDSLPPSQAGEK